MLDENITSLLGILDSCDHAQTLCIWCARNSTYTSYMGSKRAAAGVMQTVLHLFILPLGIESLISSASRPRNLGAGYRSGRHCSLPALVC
jgi:hypothetical protein